MSETTDITISNRTTALISNLNTAIANVSDIGDIKDLRAKTAAFQQYVRQAGDSLEVLNDIAEVKLRIERKAGELLQSMSFPGRGGGDTRSTDAASCQSLADLGITQKQSSRWQQMASIPDEQFDRYCADQRESGKEITQSGFLRIKYRQEDAPYDMPGLKCPACGLRFNRTISTGKVLANHKPRDRRCSNPDCNHVFRTWEIVIDPSNPPVIPIVHTQANKP